MSSRTSPFGNITIHCPRYKGNGRWKNFSHFSHKTLELVPVHIRFSASIRLCWLRWFSHFITFIYLFNIYFYFLFSFILYLFYFLSYFLIYFHLISFDVQNSIIIYYAGVWCILLCKYIGKVVSIVILGSAQ